MVSAAFDEHHQELVGRLRSKLRGRGFTVKAAEAEDIVKEAWLRVLKSATFDIGQDPVPYVWTTAWRLATKEMDAEVRHSVALREMGPLVEELAEDPQETVCRAEEAEERRRAAAEAIGSLAGQQREVLRWDCRGADTQQIAEEMGISASTVGVHRHRGMRAAQRYVRSLREQGGDLV